MVATAGRLAAAEADFNAATGGWHKMMHSLSTCNLDNTSPLQLSAPSVGEW